MMERVQTGDRPKHVQGYLQIDSLAQFLPLMNVYAGRWIVPSWSASRTSRYVYPNANWLAIGGVFPFRLSFTKFGSADVSAENVSRKSLWVSGVPPKH